jgi:hypothetical protein
MEQGNSTDGENVMTGLRIVFLGIAAALVPVSMSAHHGWTVFESEKTITLKGVVKDFHFVNPHSVVEFEVRDEKGKVRTWEGEMTSPTHLVPLGWSATSLQEGDLVTITGFPTKNGSPALRVTKIVLTDGKTLKLGNDR